MGSGAVPGESFRCPVATAQESESAAPRSLAVRQTALGEADVGALRGSPRWNGERETLRLARGESPFPVKIGNTVSFSANPCHKNATGNQTEMASILTLS